MPIIIPIRKKATGFLNHRPQCADGQMQLDIDSGNAKQWFLEPIPIYVVGKVSARKKQAVECQD